MNWLLKCLAVSEINNLIQKRGTLVWVRTGNQGCARPWPAVDGCGLWRWFKLSAEGESSV
jgi:hypothetical protein